MKIWGESGGEERKKNQSGVEKSRDETCWEWIQAGHVRTLTWLVALRARQGRTGSGAGRALQATRPLRR